MVSVIDRIMRRRRIEGLIDRLGEHEKHIRDICAEIIELTDPGDDLHVEVQRLLIQLDT